MYNRQSLYRNSQESVSSNALAAASALGKAMSPNGREVDRSKIPFYNGPSKVASMTSLSRSSSMTKKISSPSRRSSMYITPSDRKVQEQQQQEQQQKEKTSNRRSSVMRNSSLQQKHTSMSRRASSLPSDKHHSITNRSQERDAQHTFHEFGGPQTMSPNSNILNSQPVRTMKKYIPGPHGLIAVEVPIDDEVKRRKRGSYSLTSNTSHLKRSGSVNQNLRTRVSSETLNRGPYQRTSSLYNSKEKNASSQRTNSLRNSRESTSTSRTSSLRNTRETISTSRTISHRNLEESTSSKKQQPVTTTKRNIQPISSNTDNKTNIPVSKSQQNQASIKSQPKQQRQQPKQSHHEKPESIKHVPKSLPATITAQDKPPSELVSMIESSMPEETEFELENENLSVVEEQETGSNIELNELLEENNVLAERLHNNVSIASSIDRQYYKDSKVKEPERNQKLESTAVIPQTDNSEVTEITADDTIDNTANDDKSSELNIYPFGPKKGEEGEEEHVETKPSESLVNKNIQVDKENISNANRSVTSSFYDDDEGIANDTHSLNTDVSYISELEYDDKQKSNVLTEEHIQPIVLSDKSFESNNENETTDKDEIIKEVLSEDNETTDHVDIADIANSKVEEDATEGVEDILKNNPMKLTPEMEKEEIEALGLQAVDNPYLDDDDDDLQTEEIRDGSSEYMTTEENPVKTPEEPSHPIPPPMSPKRHREGAHPVPSNVHNVEQVPVATPKSTVSSTKITPAIQHQHASSPKHKDSSVSHSNNKTTMADYLRSANPYLNKKSALPSEHQSNKTSKSPTKTTHSTPAKKQVSSPVANSNKIKSPIKSPTKTTSSHKDLKPPPKLSLGNTPIKSALKKTPSNGSGNSPYDHTSANSAYLSLTTAENTRLNAQMSMENLVSRKSSVKKSNRPQSMVAQPTQRTSSSVPREVKKKPASAATFERQSSMARNSKIENKSVPSRRHSKIECSKPTQNRESIIEKTAKQMAQDTKMNSILYPAEPIPKKSSFEKLRPEQDHLGFKSMSLRAGMTNETEYEQNTMSTKFHQTEHTPSYPVTQQQRNQQLQPLTASMGPGGGSGWTSRFNDSDSDDDFKPPSNNTGSGRGRSSSINGSSPTKPKSNGFSLFKSKKHHDTQEIPQQQQHHSHHQQQQQQHAQMSSPLGTKFSKTSLRATSAMEQSPLDTKSGLRSQQRMHSDSQYVSSYRTGSNDQGDNDEHKKSNKFGNKLKKIFGRNK